MGDKYLVVVDPDFLLAGEVAQLSARGEPSTPTSILAAKRIELEQLGDALTGQHHLTSDFAIGALSHVDRARVLSTSAPALPTSGSRRYEVLEGIGALVLDEDVIPSSVVEGVGPMLTVLQNHFYSAPAPVQTTAVGGPNPWHRAHIGVAAAHPHTGQGVLVGVLDTGIDATHPEFAGKTVHFNELNAAGLSISKAARDAGDHGTHVCGIIAGTRSGVAPDTDLAVAAVLTLVGSDGRLSGSTVQIAAGVNWLRVTQFRPGIPGVDVINMSLGVGVPPGGAAQSGYAKFLDTIIRQTFKAPGALVIAAIGNDGARGAGYHGSPGNYEIVLGVGATDRTDAVASFSDWDSAWSPPGAAGPIVKPDICAPGVGVVSARPGGGYQALDGTSMATPVVTGVAALLLEQTPTLVGAPATLRTSLIALATVVCTPTSRGGRGRIQV